MGQVDLILEMSISSPALMESGVDFVAADNPHANKLMVVPDVDDA
jgi:hypothetical protein